MCLIAAVSHHGEIFSQDNPSEAEVHAQPELGAADLPSENVSSADSSQDNESPLAQAETAKPNSVQGVSAGSSDPETATTPNATSPASAAAPQVITPATTTSVAQPAATNAPAPQPPTIITPTSPGPDGTASPASTGNQPSKEISINFNNVSMIEYIRFISRISNKNFIFDEETLQFNVTIVSEEPTTVENLMTALLQELRIRNLSLLEQGNNIIIHHNPRVRSPARVFTNGTVQESTRESELVTRVFRLNTLDPVKASEILRPLLSDDALIEVLKDTNNLIITDLVTSVNKIAQLIETLDAPNSGVTIGQYVVRNAFVDSLVDLGTKILQPIAQGNPFVLVPHPTSNSIFIVSNSFIVEKALAILQNLDHNEGKTKILSLEGLNPNYDLVPLEASKNNAGQVPRGPGNAPFGAAGPGGRSPFGEDEEFGPEGGPFSPDQMSPEGRLLPGAIGSEGRTSSIFEQARSFKPGAIGATSRWSRELPLGHIERTMFFIYKLRYRKGDQIEVALRKIANSLQMTGTANVDLISTINSSQWIESSNSLIFTGPANALEKIKELILEVDIPLRQVFIEMLILNTTITDSLSYGVDWINRFGGGSTTGEQAFVNNGIPGFVNDINGQVNINGTVTNTAPPPFPLVGGNAASNFVDTLGGFTAGVIGTHLTHGGTQFSSIGALVRAIHSDQKSNILLNPKIVTEDNNTAEIFVGGTDRYKTQSITNDLGSLVTNNFQFIDVGTTLRVTPLIGNNGMITLDIIQETTAPAAGANTGGNNQDVNLVQVLTKTRSVTKIHVPDGFFVVLSGMITDQEIRSYSQIPCLGGIPIIGAAGKRQDNSDDKNNLMLFIRPLIIDTEEDFEDITKRQQDVFNEKSKFRRSWNYEIDEGLNFLNIKPTDPDEIGSTE